MSTSHPGRLVIDSQALRAMLIAASAAPSLHNSQPWRFRITECAVEVHLDPDRALPATDPTGFEQRIACGAAAFNIRMAALVHGLEPVVTILPRGSYSPAVAAIELRQSTSCPPWARELYEAIPKRHTVRGPFSDGVVPVATRSKLQVAAKSEGATLFLTDNPAELAEISGLLRKASRIQGKNDDVAREMVAWSSADETRDVEGVPAAAAGPSSTPGTPLVFRDFARGNGRRLSPVKSYEAKPLLAILAVSSHSKADDVRAGEALQRVLLTATANGLVGSFFSQVVEVEETAEPLGARFFDGPHRVARAVLRLGYGIPGITAKRRPLAETVDP